MRTKFENGRPKSLGVPDALAVSVVAALGIAFLFEIVTVNGIPYARDIQLFFLPLKRIVWQAFQEGELPLWTSLIGTGHPVLANFQSGIFYPPHWLFAITPYLAGFNWLIAIHLILGGTGMYLFCRERRFTRAPALIAAVAFMLGGYLVSLTNLVNALQTAAWTPLMLLVLVRHVRRPGPGRFAATVSVYLTAFLAGAPYTFVLSATVAMVVALVIASDAGPSKRWGGRVLGTLLVAALVVTGLAMAQILPTLEMVSESTRASGLPLSEAGRYSIDPVRLIHLVFPNDFSDPTYRFGYKLQLAKNPPWLYSLYLGIVPLLLALFAFGDRSRRREVVCWSGLALVGLVLGLGPHTPVFPAVHSHVPGFSAFRYPEKFFLLTGLSVPILAAHGFSAVQRRERGESRSSGGVWVLLLVGGALGVKTFWIAGKGMIQDFLKSAFADLTLSQHLDFAYGVWGTKLNWLLIALVVAGLLIVLHRRGLLGNRVFAALVFLLVVTDFWLAHRHLIPVVDPGFYQRRPAISETVPLERLRTTYRYRATTFDENTGSYYASDSLGVATEQWFAQQTIQPNSGAMHGVLTLGSGGAIQLRLAEERRNLFRNIAEPYRWRLLGLNSVRYLYSPHRYDDRYYSNRVTLDSLPGYLYQVEEYVPRVYLAEGMFVSGGSEAVNVALDTSRALGQSVALLGDSTGRPPERFRDWAAGADAFSFTHPDTVGAEVGEGSLVETVEVNGEAKLLSDRGSELRVEVQTDRPKFLVLTDTYYPGWRASVDGSPRPLLRANHFFRAVPVLPGDQTVVFRYHSRPLRVGSWVAGSSLLLLLLGLMSWRQRRESSAGEEPRGEGTTA